MSKSEEKKADNRVYARSVWAIAQIRKETVLKASVSAMLL